MEEMVFAYKSNGKLMINEEQKEKLLSYLNQGYTMAEVARFYGIRIQNLVRWRRQAAKKAMESSSESCPVKEGMVAVSEYKKLWDENQKLRKALGNVAYDREILREAVNIAAKKKWI